MKVGDRVRILDGSEAHNDTGVIWAIQDNGICLVELDDGGCIWPVERHEIVRHPRGGEGGGVSHDGPIIDAIRYTRVAVGRLRDEYGRMDADLVDGELHELEKRVAVDL